MSFFLSDLVRAFSRASHTAAAEGGGEGLEPGASLDSALDIRLISNFFRINATVEVSEYLLFC